LPPGPCARVVLSATTATFADAEDDEDEDED
jgi:hypothetical protein